MPSERAWSTELSTVSSPLMNMRPSSGFWKPAMIFISVDLPAPLSPSSPSTSPLRRCRLMSRSAVTAPNRLDTGSLRRRSAAPSAMSAPLPDAADVHVDAHGQQDRDPEDEVEVVGAHPLERQAVAQHTEEEGTEQCADDRALTACEQGAADDGGRHGTEH